MKLKEIIELMNSNNLIRDDIIMQRINQLKIYYKHYFNDEVMLLHDKVTNTGSYCTIIPSNDLYESINQYICNNYHEISLNVDEYNQLFEQLCYYIENI